MPKKPKPKKSIISTTDTVYVDKKGQRKMFSSNTPSSKVSYKKQIAKHEKNVQELDSIKKVIEKGFPSLQKIRRKSL
jgi:hypothetical protein